LRTINLLTNDNPFAVVKENEIVKQGQLIGYTSDISVNYKTPPNHVHIRIENKNYNHDGNRDVIDPTPIMFGNPDREK
jgi:hypothetical protein